MKDPIPVTAEEPNFIEDSREFMAALNKMANLREAQMHRIGDFLRVRPALHATLLEVLQEYPPKRPEVY